MTWLTLRILIKHSNSCWVILLLQVELPERHLGHQHVCQHLHGQTPRCDSFSNVSWYAAIPERKKNTTPLLSVSQRTSTSFLNSASVLLYSLSSNTKHGSKLLQCQKELNVKRTWQTFCSWVSSNNHSRDSGSLFFCWYSCRVSVVWGSSLESLLIRWTSDELKWKVEEMKQFIVRHGSGSIMLWEQKKAF